MNFAAFLGVSAVVIIAPGQDTALTIRNTLVGGRAGGIATAAGVATGLATWTLATSAGLAALLVASQPLFLALRLAGAAYLVFLGFQALRAAFRSPSGRGQASFGRLLLLGMIFCSMTLTWLTLYAIVVARVGDFLRRDRIQRAIEATTGLVLIGLGLRLATERR